MIVRKRKGKAAVLPQAKAPSSLPQMERLESKRPVLASEPDDDDDPLDEIEQTRYTLPPQPDPEYEALMDYEYRATNGYLTEEDTGGHCDLEDQETDDPCRVVDLTVLRVLREGHDELGPSLACFVLGKRAFLAYLAAADETGAEDLGCFLGVQVTKDANIDWDFVGGRCKDGRVVDFRRRASSSRVSSLPCPRSNLT
jgi:hypothetical protein